MRSLLVAVILGQVLVVSCVKQCEEAKKCGDRFVKQASSAASDQGLYCRYVREQVDCLLNIKNQCTAEERVWIDDNIRTIWHNDPECSGATSPASYVTAALGLAFIAFIFKKL